MKQEEHSTASAKQRRLYFVILSILAVVTIGAIIVTLVVDNNDTVNPLQQAEESEGENLLQAQDESSGQKTEEDSRSAAVQGDLVKPNSSIEDAKGTDSSLQSAEADDEGETGMADESEDEAAAGSLGEEADFDAENDTMMWPVSGNVLMEYSNDGLIYDETLDQYRANDSISIAAAEGEEVVAAAAGTVKSIGNNDTLGNYVVISHGNGLETTYGQLQEVVDVAVDEFVSKGERIGCIAEPTWYSLSLGTHVQFQVTQDGVPVDPTIYLENTLDE